MVTLSTTKAEFIAASSSAYQAVWLRRILQHLSHEQCKSTMIYCDNKLTKDKVVELVQCSMQEQVAEIITKPLKLDVFLKLQELIVIKVN
ncbi:unnamed protein product [Malus baccata var. baccata]